MKRLSLPILWVCGASLAISGFFAGVEVEAHRALRGGTFRTGTIRSETQPPTAAAAPVPAPSGEQHAWPLADVKSAGRVVGEFEHQTALLLGVNELVQYHPQTLVQIVAAVHDHIKVIGVVANDEQRTKTIELLEANHLPREAIDFFEWPVEAMWVRDYAPYFVVGSRATAVDFTYPEPNRDLEDNFSVAFAATFRLPFDHCHLTLEGGNLTSNGENLCVTTTKIATVNALRGYDIDGIGKLLRDHFHFDRWLRVKPLENEPTGHADMFLTLCSANKVILGSYRTEDDPVNAQILDDNATILNGEPTKNGKLEVIRIPMPNHKDGNWRTYTNVIYANGVVLVPQYPDIDPAMDKEALDIFQKALPDWKVVGINCAKLITKRGALHCISHEVPVLPEPQ